MAATRFSEDIRSVSELKVRAAEIVEQVRRSRRPILLYGVVAASLSSWTLRNTNGWSTGRDCGSRGDRRCAVAGRPSPNDGR